MPRACTVCTHADRDAIDRALVEAAPMRRIAAEHSLAETSMRRHAARHLPTTLVLAAEAAEVMRADDLLGEERRLHREALEAAKASGHLGATLQAIDRAQRSVALLAGLFDRLPEIHDWELVMRWEEPEVSPCKKCGYEEP